jgi:hypothetical protein
MEEGGDELAGDPTAGDIIKPIVYYVYGTVSYLYTTTYYTTSVTILFYCNAD